MAELDRRRALARGAGRADRVRRQHDLGRLTGQERIDLLLDPGSFLPTLRLLHSDERDGVERSLGGDGALHGFGTVTGRPVAVFASDPTVKNATGSTSVMRATRAHRAVAARWGLPYFDLHQGGGARITEIMSSAFLGQRGTSMGAEHAFGRRMLSLCAVVGDYYAPWNLASNDVVVMCSFASAAMTSPVLLKAATGQDVSARQLGGAAVHGVVTGQVDAVVPDERDAIALLRTVFGYLPSFPGGPVPRGPAPGAERRDPGLGSVVPRETHRSYDVRDVLRRVLDAGSLLEFSPDFAANLVTGLARLGGTTVAVIANQPLALAGAVDVRALAKAQRILDLVDTCRLPLVSFVDTPGVLTTLEQEHARLVREIYRTSIGRLRPRTPKLTVVLRKGIGFALFVMSAGDPDGLTFAWPSARMAFTGPEPAARVVHARELAATADPDARLRELVEDSWAAMAPWRAEAHGYLDGVIDPAETRPVLVRGLQALTGCGR